MNPCSRCLLALLLAVNPGVWAEEAVSMETLKKRYDQYLSQLRKADTSSASARLEIRSLQKQQALLTQQISAHEREYVDLARELEMHKGQLARQLRRQQRGSFRAQIYSLESAQEYAREYDRRLRYRHYFSSLRSLHIANIQAITELQDRLQVVRITLNRDQEQLAQRQSQLQRERERLQQGRDSARKILVRIKSAIERNQRLRQYSVIKGSRQLRRAVEASRSDRKRYAGGFRSIRARKKSIPWPSVGVPRKMKHFDNAWRIQQKGQQRVYSIGVGEVLSVQWMPNLGNTVIVDHGNRFRGVYAQLDASFVKVGERIAGGADIAISGSNAGQEDNGMIFILLHRARQLDLREWMVRSNRKS